MVTGLAAATRLEDLLIMFHGPVSFPHQSLVTPLTRAILPALTRFQFEGYYNYLEDLMAQLDSPRLKSIIVLYFNNQVIEVIVSSQLAQFLDRTGDIELARCCRARNLIVITFP